VELEGHTGNSSPALLGGLVVFSKTSNGNVRYVKLPFPKELKAIVATPEVSIETAKARAILPTEIKYEDAVFNICRSCLLLGALAERKWNLLYWGMQDQLHQPYREKLLPSASEVLQTAIDRGADGACWSGAGASMIAFARNKCEQIGEAMVSKFASFGIKSMFKVLEVDEQGAKIIDDSEEN
jgi:homoserine kinase